MAKKIKNQAQPVSTTVDVKITTSGDASDVAAASTIATAVATASTQASNKLAKGLTHILPTSPSITEDGKHLQRRNYLVKERQVVVIYSTLLKTAHVTLHIGYTNKDHDAAIALARRDLSKQRITENLAQAPDLIVQVMPEKLTHEIDQKMAKENAYMKFQRNGFNMVGTLPRIDKDEREARVKELQELKEPIGHLVA